MSDKRLSLFGNELSRFTIREAVIGACGTLEFEDEDRNGNESLLVKGKHGETIRFNLLLNRYPGDKFSEIAFSAVAFFRNLETSAVQAKHEVIKRIGEMSMVFGVVIEPDFLGDDDWRWGALFSVAESADAVVFDGFSVVASNGDLILNLEGKTEDDFL